MRYEIRPLGVWTGPATPADQRRGWAAFRAGWQSTLDLLGYETDRLGARLVVLQVDVRGGEIRRDGMLRADAKVGHPGVRVSFDSVHGPLTYATDTYTGWQANVRAIALALEALRAVDRYGVSKSGEQYRGWTAVTAQPAEMTREIAAGLIAQWAEPDDAEKRETAVRALLRSPSLFLAQLYRRAAKRAHPDVTGDDGDDMKRLNQARDLLDHLDKES